MNPGDCVGPCCIVLRSSLAQAGEFLGASIFPDLFVCCFKEVPVFKISAGDWVEDNIEGGLVVRRLYSRIKDHSWT